MTSVPSPQHFSALGLVLLLLASGAVAQTRTEHRSIGASDTSIQIASSFADYSTLALTVDSSIHLTYGRDFTIDTLAHSLLLTEPAKQLLFSRKEAIHNLEISYFALPLGLKTSYTRHRILAQETMDSLTRSHDTSAQSRMRRIENVSEPQPLFANAFQKSGSITRGFQLGSNRDLSLTSGFNLQFSGDLAKDVTVTGALSEESTPIQPEGTTQTLRDVDRIYIQMKAGDHFAATFGDFFLDMGKRADLARTYQAPAPLGVSLDRTRLFGESDASEFTAFSRKLLGAQGTVDFPHASLMVAGASARGKYNSLVFQGQESFQGPYRLTGKNGERAIVVVAGTERVYVDGELQVRGERNDYVIDYALSEIIFQPRRLITSASRITVDYQYSDEQYNRSLIATKATGSLFEDHIQISGSFVREGDNPDAALNLSLSDSDKSLLRNAGNDPFAAVKSGVTIVGREPSGRAKGNYIRVDTTINGASAVAYLYAPSDSTNAIYNVSFGIAGAGRGSYTRQAIGQYQFVGPGRGDYDTLVYLPLPQLTQIAGFTATIIPVGGIGIRGELAASNFSANRLGGDPQNDIAFKSEARFQDSLVIGALDLSASIRRVGQNFRSIDRVSDVEYQRRYGLEQPDLRAAAMPILSSELTRDARLAYSPASWLTLESGFGSYAKRELGFNSERLTAKADLREDSGYRPHLLLNVERLPTSDTSRHESAVWQRGFGELSKTIAFGKNALTVGARTALEKKEARADSSLLLNTHSAAFTDIEPSVQLKLGEAFNIKAQYDIRREDSSRLGTLAQLSDARTLRFTTQYLRSSGFSSTLDLTLRKKNYIDSAALFNAGGNQSSLLLRWEPRYTTSDRGFAADALYEISNERAARIERFFFPVQHGQGNYTYIGDVNHNGVQDAEDFQLARYSDQADFILLNIPTEKLFPTINLRSLFHLHLAPKELFGLENSTGIASDVLSALGSETTVRIEETSTTEKERDIYLFSLSKFQNDSTTIKGLIEFEENLNILNAYRLRFFERRTASQFTTGLERAYIAERSVTGRFKLMDELSNETKLTSGTDISVSPNGDNGGIRPHSTSTLDLTTEFSYNPYGSVLDYGLRLEGTRGRERVMQPTTALQNDALLRLGFALQSKARIRAEIERAELTLKSEASDNTPSSFYQLPFALTGGRSLGVTWLWTLALDYQFGGGIIATIAYDGRNARSSTVGENLERQTIHNARAEMRASF